MNSQIVDHDVLDMFGEKKEELCGERLYIVLHVVMTSLLSTWSVLYPGAVASQDTPTTWWVRQRSCGRYLRHLRENMAGIKEDYSMDDTVEKVKSGAKVRKGRGFGDSDRDSEHIQYESVEDTGGPGAMR